MTYYSDLLIVIDEIDALKHGLKPRHSVAELRDLCGNILAIDPTEELASQLIDSLRDLDSEIDAAGIRIFLFEEFRRLAQRPRTTH